MALRRKITAEQFTALSELLQAEYKKDANGAYVLDTDDASELTSTIERLRKAEKDLKTSLTSTQAERDDLAARIAAAEHNDLSKRGDVEALNKSWETKFNATTGELKAQLSARDDLLKSSAVDGFASKLANEISTSPNLMVRVIKDRLVADLEGNAATVKILGTDGKPSALTTEDFKKELLANKEYAAILIGSRASGSAAKPPAGSARTTNPPITPPDPTVKLSELRGPALVSALRARKQAREDANAGE